MSEVSERIELLINRYLDEAITSEQQVELDDALRSHPAARSMLEDYQLIDRCAGQLLRESGCSTAELSPAPMRLHGQGPSRWTRWMWYVPGAAAACLAAVLWWSQPNSSIQVADTGSAPKAVEMPPLNANVSTPMRRSGIVPAAHQLGFENHTVDRDDIWYVAPDGRIYLIERQLAQVSKRPSAESQVWLAAGGI